MSSTTATIENTDRAVVIGASIAGLAAAQALSDTFAHVTVVERDVLPAGAGHRRAVPQDKHVHSLLAAGAIALENLFPGFGDDMVLAGAVPFWSGVDWYLDGHRIQAPPQRGRGVVSSRSLLESILRDRVAALPNVTFVDNCAVLNPVATTDRRRVTGVLLASQARGGTPTLLPADLVVDASGRGGRSAIWLTELGFQPPRESKMTVETTYVTRSYRREPQHLDGRPGTIVSPFPGSPCGGFLLAQENDEFIFTLGGLFGAQPPMDDDALLTFAQSLPVDDFADFLRTATRISDPVKMRYPTSVRRHYEELDEFPAGYLVLGDAVCSFNPVHGHGMSIAALSAVILRDLLAAGPNDLAQRFFRAVAGPIEATWTFATRMDSRFPASGVAPTLESRLLDRYIARMARAAATDDLVAAAVVSVLQLTATPDTLLAPAVLGRVLSHVGESAMAG
ncbi:NAD(P)/FAD-dependent oxidoreductase [Nocardia brasiliensis]|uniref:NAD(P)/FAD-dependent oxidoreductase n=1 Tax=Nocardia brasiliensis TaxID=37326 RepID=UPI0004A6D5DB|nr:NAD(P)-binding protein [Nocardia brasiliensis]